MKLERIETADGSFTYVDTLLDVSYRSVHGAKAESDYVFIEGTELRQTTQESWSVLELGFGTGMNFSNTYTFTRENNIKLEYYSLEPFLMPIEDLLIDDELKNSMNHRTITKPNLSLNIVDAKWQDWRCDKTFDAYYHDPFGPTTSPQCWGTTCFRWAISHLKPDGRLATYGASTAGRRAMQAAGFVVAKRKGFDRKREMTVCAKDRKYLSDLKTLKVNENES